MKKLLMLAVVVSSAITMAWDRPCARVFQYANFAGASLRVDAGDRLNLRDVTFYDANENTTRDWHHVVSSVQVFPGCVLTGYQYDNFNNNYETGYPIDGWTVSWRAHHEYSRSEAYLGGYDNAIDSLSCYCD